MPARATYYKHIQPWVEVHHGFVPQTCWIADVKERHGLTRGPAPNRKGAGRVKPCPPEKVAAIEDALRHYGMIS